jgi:hypothetical protein
MSLWIDPAQPVNYNSPLNRGLVSWWLAGPNACGVGSGIWRDLAKRNNGTLTNGPLWSGQSHPGGWGSIDTAANQYVNFGSGMGNMAAGDFTWVAWMYVRSFTSGFMAIVEKGEIGSGGGREFSIFVDTSGNVSFLQLGGTSTGTPAVGFVEDQWQHFVITRVGSSVVTYRNGIQTGTDTNGGTTANASSVLAIGDNITTGGSDFDGLYNDLRFYTRALSASEVAALYQESLAGYPTTLNWLRPRIYFDAGAAPAGGAFSIFDSPIITAAA